MTLIVKFFTINKFFEQYSRIANLETKQICWFNEYCNNGVGLDFTRMELFGKVEAFVKTLF